MYIDKVHVDETLVIFKFWVKISVDCLKSVIIAHVLIGGKLPSYSYCLVAPHVFIDVTCDRLTMAWLM